MNNLRVTHVIKIVCAFVFLLTFGCSSQKENMEDHYSYEIYSLILGDFNYLDYSSVLPPPPLSYSDDYTEQDFLGHIDSLKYIYRDRLLKISLLPELLGEIEEDLPKDKGSKSKFSFIKKLKGIKSAALDTTMLIYDKKKLMLELTDMSKLKDSPKEYFDKYQFLLAFSRVVFSDDYTMAAVRESYTLTRMDAFSTISYFKRKNDKWVKIQDSIPEIFKKD